MSRILLIFGLLALYAAVPASATSVSIENGNELFVTGHPGETNQLVIYEGLNGVTVRDQGASIVAPPPCTSESANSAVCPFSSGKMWLLASGGDGNDSVEVLLASDGHFVGAPLLPKRQRRDGQ